VTPDGWELLQQLDRDLLALNASPGGSADMLAATLFLDLVRQNFEWSSKGSVNGQSRILPPRCFKWEDGS
jgi:ATP:dephospho-CoA triphosphoribosyl transferase